MMLIDLAASGPPDKLRVAAQQFEAMTIGELLKPVFATVDSADGPFGGGAGEAAFRPMLVDAIAQKIEAAGGIGLADGIYRSLLTAQERQR
ncbi:MAG TPA: rod-binding protein [Acetobacteraceae bacterium]|nr:rod-binding protein [Acetobacteraceae bacterium]